MQRRSRLNLIWKKGSFIHARDLPNFEWKILSHELLHGFVQVKHCSTDSNSLDFRWLVASCLEGEVIKLMLSILSIVIWVCKFRLREPFRGEYWNKLWPNRNPKPDLFQTTLQVSRKLLEHWNLGDIDLDRKTFRYDAHAIKYQMKLIGIG